MDEEQERSGCLTVILRWFGIDLAKSRTAGEVLPYHLRDDFLSAAERSFYGVLCGVIGERAIVCPKVRVADLLYVPRGEGSMAHQNRINAKHVDFVLCAPDTMSPLAAIELDDSSHGRAKRIERDDLLDRAFAAAGLPLLRFAARRQYEPRALAAELKSLFQEPEKPARAATPSASSDSPSCPKCGAAMVVKTTNRGPQQGQQFYGCPNFPQCRSTLPIAT